MRRSEKRVTNERRERSALLAQERLEIQNESCVLYQHRCLDKDGPVDQDDEQIQDDERFNTASQVHLLSGIVSLTVDQTKGICSAFTLNIESRKLLPASSISYLDIYNVFTGLHPSWSKIADASKSCPQSLDTNTQP